MESAESTKSNEEIKPSFDCDKAASIVEKTICADEELASEDKYMTSVYRGKMGLINDEGKKELLHTKSIFKES
ncbi:hypothetical protein CQA53_01825 [Helicobacter didelphidarum]|uniref:Uncharacterized protein n=1 Tax=Helicobacter didelphidarum TaxID=2040648 RepID=A0A3D8IQ42_9HELI|nr:hypothetical protein [Helicobacter didelphidarum]RDU67026.1 hypothetical protein CQA53_01825 [Helicobacter didelphidarum]